MIKFGEHTALLPTDAMEAWFSSLMPTDRALYFGPAHARMTQTGNNILYPNWCRDFAPKINQLVIPSGASRWSHMLFLTNYREGQEILNKGWKTLEYQATVRGEQEGEHIHKVSLRMLPLGLRLLQNRDLETDAISTPVIVPLVDARYNWHGKTAKELSGLEFTTPQELLDHLFTLVPEDVTQQELHEAHTLVPNVLDNDHSPLAPIIDSVLQQLGCSLVPDMTPGNVGKFVVTTDELSPGIFDANHDHGYTDLNGETTNPINYRGEPRWVLGDAIQISRQRDLPNFVTVIHQAADDTTTTLDVFQSAAQLNSKASGGELTIRWPWDEANGPVLRQTGVEWYNQFARRLDRVAAGVQPWQMSRYEDVVVYSQSITNGKAEAWTRIRTWPGNYSFELPTSGVTLAGHSEEDENACSCCESVRFHDVLLSDGTPAVRRRKLCKQLGIIREYQEFGTLTITFPDPELMVLVKEDDSDDLVWEIPQAFFTAVNTLGQDATGELSAADGENNRLVYTLNAPSSLNCGCPRTRLSINWDVTIPEPVTPPPPTPTPTPP